MPRRFRRIWFKPLFIPRIVEGVKTVTTRDHECKAGGYKAATGSFYRPSDFAVIRIVEAWKRKDFQEMVDDWRREGFLSLAEFEQFAKESGLGEKYSKAQKLWGHRFELLEVLPQ